jgi:TonB family protein
MPRLAKLTISLFVSSLAFGQYPADLLQQAKALLETSPTPRLRAIARLREANSIWDGSPGNDPARAESLDLLAILLRGATGIALWRADAASLTAKALEIREALADNQPSEDLALALELQADALGREDAGAPLWQRAFEIRRKRINDLEQAVRIEHPLAPPDFPTPAAGPLSAPKVTTKIDPQYSAMARLAKISCTVQLGVVVNPEGTAQDLRLRRACGYGMDERAAEAVMQWRFQPGTKGTQPVLMRATIEVNFRLL